MTFNFVYMEQGRSVPDQKHKLESCFRAVIETAVKPKKLKNNRLLIGGKSMGGRIGYSGATGVMVLAPLPAHYKYVGSELTGSVTYDSVSQRATTAV